MNPQEVIAALQEQARKKRRAGDAIAQSVMLRAADELVRLQADNERRKQAGDALAARFARFVRDGEIDCTRAAQHARCSGPGFERPGPLPVDEWCDGCLDEAAVAAWRAADVRSPEPPTPEE